MIYYTCSENILVAILSGVSTAAFTVSWLLSVRQGAYMMVDVFLLVGVMLPLMFCRVLYSEEIHLVQWIGIALLLVASYIIFTYNTSIKGKMTPKALVLLVLCAVSNGVTDFSQKLFVIEVENGNVATFNMYTYLFAGAVLLICFAFSRAREKKTVALRPARIFAMIWKYYKY